MYLNLFHDFTRRFIETMKSLTTDIIIRGCTLRPPDGVANVF